MKIVSCVAATRVPPAARLGSLGRGGSAAARARGPTPCFSPKNPDSLEHWGALCYRRSFIVKSPYMRRRAKFDPQRLAGGYSRAKSEALGRRRDGTSVSLDAGETSVQARSVDRAHRRR